MSRDCVCSGAGWCERHQVLKSAHWVKLCQTNDEYFQAWEEGRGPGQRAQRGLGDLVESGLKAVGITEQRYKNLKGAIGLKRDCNCPGRKRALNELGKQFGIGRETT